MGHNFMTVICNKHSGHPHKIAQFFRAPGSTWQGLEAYSAQGKRELKQWRAEQEANPPEETGNWFDDFIAGTSPAGDRGPIVAQVADGRLAAIGSDPHMTYDLTCGRCKKRNRHASFSRRGEKLWPVLTLLAAAGLREVTVEILQSACTKWDSDHS